MAESWCNLPWTSWSPLEREAIRRTAPALPGVYRIRHEGGEEPRRLVYVGQTGRTLRQRLLSLAAGVNAGECPFNDPHTAAPHLWLMRQRDGARLECSCASVAGDVQALRGMEDMLLWRHRIETGLSAEANYGRFYPGYARPTNRWIVRVGRAGSRNAGRRAVPLPEDALRVDSTSAIRFCRAKMALCMPHGGRGRRCGRARAIFRRYPAVYCIHDAGAQEAAAAYIGETSSLAARAASHAATPWPVREPTIAYLLLPAGTPKHVLRELESDLLGWHFWWAGRPPAAQYSFTGRLTIREAAG